MSTDAMTVEGRARIHAALGDPARLAIVDTLTLGDASPGEIAHSLGMPTNLVAHHVKVLETAGLLVRTRSEGDRRRTYLQLRPEALAALAPAALQNTRRVVFVCTRNSARSQLAAALLHQRTGMPAASAGTHPATRIHPRAVQVARQHGITLDPTATAHIGAVIGDDDLVIAVCDNAHEELADRARLHWSIPDPVPADTDAAFETAFAEIAARVERLAPALHTTENSHD
ncbi:helix-turn-helix domain-containing protein [Couchioplanes caeruleus]|uniref:arsenate reductase/protein-tyrosine-phosphatase family protein n=1 Tax=Couchioplanes caeruleus TaxID=56438 RepID=UPI0020BF651C|nr:MarR family transcriptional regulator [Couchioplanes caeruleus]UQU67506.1 helix-turn-helix domain-containing protein [Couchioplanes caeruleus]